MHLYPKDLGVKVDEAGHCAHQDPQGLSLCQSHPDKVRWCWNLRWSKVFTCWGGHRDCPVGDSGWPAKAGCNCSQRCNPTQCSRGCSRACNIYSPQIWTKTTKKKESLPEQGGGVYFCFSDPGRLVSWEENLDGDGLSIPNASPNLTVPGHQSDLHGFSSFSLFTNSVLIFSRKKQVNLLAPLETAEVWWVMDKRPWSNIIVKILCLSFWHLPWTWNEGLEKMQSQRRCLKGRDILLCFG